MSLEEFKESTQTSLEAFITATRKNFFSTVVNLASLNSAMDTIVDANLSKNTVTTLKEHLNSIGEITNVEQVPEGLVLTSNDGKMYLLDIDFKITNRNEEVNDESTLTSIRDILMLDEIQDELDDNQFNKIYKYLEDNGIDIDQKYDDLNLLEDAWTDTLNDLRTKYENIADTLEDGYIRYTTCPHK